MSLPFKTSIREGIAEMILDHPPVNAFDSKLVRATVKKWVSPTGLPMDRI